MELPSSELVYEVTQNEVKAVADIVKVLDPAPGKPVDTELLFSEAQKALNKFKFLETSEEGIAITLEGQILLSLIMARTESVIDFVTTLNLTPIEMTEIIKGLSDESRIGESVMKIMDKFNSGQPGLLVNVFAFLVYRAIVLSFERMSPDVEDAFNKMLEQESTEPVAPVTTTVKAKSTKGRILH
jgi:hypothetical protein